MQNANSIFSGSDALDWNEAMSIIGKLQTDGHPKEALLMCCGCFLGLRISDLLRLTWDDLCLKENIDITEKKTGKVRRLKINPTLHTTAQDCMQALHIEDYSLPALASNSHGGRYPMTRQRAAQLLKWISDNYGIKSAEKFTTHSLRKTFGRRVWQQECESGRGEQALLLLCEVFGHSSVNITKRYLGIRRDEIMSVYDALN